ncbi:hypothetical protein Q5R05_03185 [Leuconostoc carnosum]|uniref:hypothetical protein n=1 Tax=Leuconostoc TaxID=1243 RepID=UPI00272E8405|nr:MULTISPECIES: hypothetical protein [Leuconostoc]MDV8936247.1 hypothetical protein [Leuconostoc sp.]WLC98386.1 hypothetical protein Q5R05_03185 [Leuconostoc carnosum]
MRITDFLIEKDKINFKIDKKADIDKLYAANREGDMYPLKWQFMKNQCIEVQWTDIPDYGTYRLMIVQKDLSEISLVVDRETKFNFIEFSSGFGWKKSTDQYYFIQSLRPSISKKTRDLVLLNITEVEQVVSVITPKKINFVSPSVVIRNQAEKSVQYNIPADFRRGKISFDLSDIKFRFGEKFYVFIEDKGVKYRLYNPKSMSQRPLSIHNSDEYQTELYYSENKRLAIRTQMPRLDISNYMFSFAKGILVDTNKMQISIALGEEIAESVQDVQYYDNQGFLESFKSFENYRIYNNELIIDFSKMPVAGEILILISTINGLRVVKYDDLELTFGQWKAFSGVDAELILTPISNGMIRPERRQILVQQFDVNGSEIILDLPHIQIDEVVFMDENETRIFPIEYATLSEKLVIKTKLFQATEGCKYKAFILSQGIRYQIFHPSSGLKDEFARYHLTNEVNKYFYFSKFGYLKFAYLTTKQLDHLNQQRLFESKLVTISDEKVQLEFMESPSISDSDKIIARRFSNMILFDHAWYDNKLVLSVESDNTEMVKGFNYTIEVAHEIDGEIIYTPIMLKQLVTDEDGNKNLSTKTINLTGDPIELLTWKPTEVVGVIKDGIVTVKAVGANAFIERVFAEYQERPVFSDVTQGIPMEQLRTRYHKLRIIYRQDGLLNMTSVTVSAVINNLFV